MNEKEANPSSCCSENKDVPAKKPSFKKNLTLLNQTTSTCEDDCCKNESTSEIKHEVVTKDHEQKGEYLVHGMDCSACAVTLERALSQLNGVSRVQVNYSTGKMQVAIAEASAFDLLPDTAQKLGYSLQAIDRGNKARTYRIEGMDCGSCALTIENHFKNRSDVSSVSVNFASGKMTIEHDTPVDEIIKEVSKAGYKATLISNRRQAEEKKKDKSTNSVVLSGALLLLGFLGSFSDVSDWIITSLYALSIVIGGYKPARSAYYAIKSRSLDMNVLMTAAVIGAAAIGEWFEGATVVWLFALGNALQTRSIEKTRNSIRGLIDLAPPEANVKQGNSLIRKPVGEISVGEFIVVKPGDKIPLDGRVVQGHSSVNQAPITGESVPVDKEVGDDVYAGTINEHGVLEISVTKLSEDTTLSKIIHLVEEAQEKKAPTEAFVDRFARIYTPIVFVLALAVMVIPPIFGAGTWAEWFYKGLELLVVACPCALVISTPVAIVSAIGNAAKNGILIKGGAFLEVAGTISAIAFDKTGTLTEGKPRVSRMMALENEEGDLLSIACALEKYSTHPIAKAIVEYAEERGVTSLPADRFKNLVGQGVAGWIGDKEYIAGNLKLFQELKVPYETLEPQIRTLQQEGNTVVIVGTRDRILGVIAVADSIRKVSVNAVRELHEVGLKQIVMLTGDNEGTAKKIALHTGVDRYFAELMPEDKASAIKQLQEEGHKVAMVGDGINDAPALATADLGIAMGGAGTDTAMETADIVLMADNLEKLPHTVELSRKALKIIKQNIWFSLIVKAAALILIFPDVLTLWIAVMSDTGAALIVILNSMRLMSK
ncbi:heavy metal translocating P-type ATPase [Cohnella sp. CIP 111063]|uniref:heavy metal translocating P-type ATPase n=1 Tax=unclassified Cohnella TaxID=2636738 RepID=UPI000B8C6637|nr:MULTISPECIES: heavy metal translocating P-type ATPase [unclassified Cohnella]OXS54927.1 heavy metal translocating P-type ATPase [Cohnella sp. CIP 111063]PRX65073.1 Cd2+/Zn2+-exporting ATPase [Cohnella sp. SGD-V74]